jgi:TonB family protein
MNGSRQRWSSMAAILMLGVVSCATVQQQVPVACCTKSMPTSEPKLKALPSLPSNFEMFPYSEARQGHVGYVLAEYSIDERGRPTQLNLLESTSATFADKVRRIVAHMRYVVPPDWAASIGPTQRFKMQFHFDIPGYPTLPGHLGILDTVITVNPGIVGH